MVTLHWTFNSIIESCKNCKNFTTTAYKSSILTFRTNRYFNSYHFFLRFAAMKLRSSFLRTFSSSPASALDRFKHDPDIFVQNKSEETEKSSKIFGQNPRLHTEWTNPSQANQVIFEKIIRLLFSPSGSF